MWRSRALAARRACELGRLTGAGTGTGAAGSNLLPLYKTTTPQHEVLHQFRFLTPKTPFPLNPRFFSYDSAVPEPSPESQLISEEADASSVNNSLNVSEEWGEEVTSPSPIPLTMDDVGSVVMENESIDDNESVVIENDGIQGLDLEKLERVRSLLVNGGGDSGESIESRLGSLDLTLNEEFVLKVLESSDVLKGSLILFFKWATSRKDQNGFSVTRTALDSLVGAICSSGQLSARSMYGLRDIVKEVGEREDGVVTTAVLNQLISSFSRLGKGLAGYEVFSLFEKFNCVPDADSYYYTLEGLCRRWILDRVGPVCDKMLIDGTLPEQPEKIGNMICFLCKTDKVKEAHSVYLSAKAKGKYPPHSSVNVLISCLCDDENEDGKSVYLASEMLEDFPGEKRKDAIKPFASVIQGLCRIKDVEAAKRLLFKMIDAGPPPGNAVFNLIINSLSKAGDLEDAKKIMKVMESRGLKPDLFTFNVIMSGYAKGGEMEEAAKVLAEAKKSHKKLNSVIYHTIIRGYCKIEEFDKAVKLLSEMKKYGAQPTVDEYNKLIQSLCLKAADWPTAQKLVKEMKKSGLYVSGSTEGLVRAVRELDEEGVKEKEASLEA